MKNRALAIALTIVIFAVIAVCFLRPTDTDFGCGDEVYTMRSIATNIGGDVELVQLEHCGWLPRHPSLTAQLRSVDTSRLFVLGTADGSAEGRIEKLDKNQNWEHLSYTGQELMSTGFRPSDGKTVINSNGIQWDACFPASDPGQYKVTIYFHETGQNHNFSVWFTVDVPEQTGHEYDVCGVSVKSAPAEYSDYTVGYVMFALRSNSGAPLPYLDAESIAVLDSDIKPYIDYAPGYDRYYRKPVDCEHFRADNVAGYLPIALPGVLADKTCRLSMYFTENSDGSGERYTLTLDLRFDE